MKNDSDHGDISSPESRGSPSLDHADHALLESLFYSEMMLLDGSSSVSSDFMAYLSSDPESSANVPDAKTIAERAMLNDFGVAQVSTANNAISAPSMPENPQLAAPGSVWVDKQGPSVAAQEQPQSPGSNDDSQQDDRAQLLVDQFANLAGRLGISLPSNVLTELSRQAIENEAQGNGNSGIANASNGTIPSKIQTGLGKDPQDDSAQVASHIRQLQTTAEAAIAAVSQNRKRPQDGTSESSKPPLYSKRRKKPRLSDCESKLAMLKAENAMLTRHLDNVSNKSEKFEEARRKQEQDMRRLVEERADPEELKCLLSKFSEMYSDYGKHRAEELSFHLQQLERYVFGSTLRVTHWVCSHWP